MEVQLQERVVQGSRRRVDRERSVIEDCKLLGEHSVNPPPRNNTYPKSTREKAIGLIEGARVYLDHPDKPNTTRRYGDGFGFVRKVYEAGDGLRGNLFYNPKHQFAEQVVWDAENAPENVCFSINGDGKSRSANGRQLVEEITAIHSVDLVSRGATTRSLFESANGLGIVPAGTAELGAWLRQGDDTSSVGRRQAVSRGTVGALVERLDRAGQRFKARLLREAGVMGASVSDTGTDFASAAQAGLAASWQAVFSDDRLDTAAKLRAAKKILDAFDKLKLAADAEREAATDHKPYSAKEGRRHAPRSTISERIEVPVSSAALGRWLRG